MNIEENKETRLKESDKMRYWRSKNEEWKKSNLTQPDFCARENINYTTFCYWRGVFTSKQKEKPKLLPVHIQKQQAASSNSGIRIQLPNQIQCIVPSNTNKADLVMILDVLRGV